MALKPGTKLGPYEILSQIGAGGMGEVYKAHDTRLNRTVALKTLLAHLADKPELRERFQREAETIAGLQHPHICVLHDIRKDNDIDYLVMEYLEGETLAQRLHKGPLPLDQILQYAIEIADALDKAHRKGFTHRDIKPVNIMLVKEGSGWSTKLLDFGLAKLKQENQSRARQQAGFLDSQAPTPPLGTPQIAGTVEGNIIGTLLYMAPEQAEGKKDEIDPRTDIFSFGVVLYEMLTGRKAFEGKSHMSLISSILKDTPPPISSLAPMTPPALDRLVKKCLAKERDARWQSATDLHDELQWIREGGGQAAQPKPVAKGWQRVTVLGFAALAIAALTSITTSYIRQRATPDGRSALRLALPIPPEERLFQTDTPTIALSPDGTYLAYAASRNGGPTQLFLRALGSSESKPISGTDGAKGTFFSPDGQWIGYVAGNKLKKVSISGGASVTICDAPGFTGASWGSDDAIFFAPSLGGGIWRVSASGGKPQEITKPDRSKNEFSHRWPQLLPGGKALLFAIGSGQGWDDYDIAVLKLEAGERRILVHGGTYPRFVSTGHLVYYRAGTLLAIPFDPIRLEVTSSIPVTLAEGVYQTRGTVGPEYSLTATGTVAYVPASLHQFERRLVWMNPKGEIEPISAPPRYYGSLDLAPGGRRVALLIDNGTGDIWVYDLTRDVSTRITSEGRIQGHGVWTPDGKRVAYQANRDGYRKIFWKLADGTGPEELLAQSENTLSPTSFSPDGKWLVYRESNATTGFDIMVLPLDGDRKPRAFLQTPFSEQPSAISPDGKWIAYLSNESGRDEVYVQPFPNPGSKGQVSTEGADAAGTRVYWAANGKELFYTKGGKLMAVDVTMSPTFSAGKSRLLSDSRIEDVGGISPDGQRFLMIQRVEPEQPATQINVVLNWFEELKRKAPLKQ